MTGNVAPETVKPAPLTLPELTVTAAVPLDVSVTGSVALEPSTTSPKARLGVLKDNWEVVPMPLKLTVEVGVVDEVLLIDSMPVAAPPAVGANWTLSVTA